MIGGYVKPTTRMLIRVYDHGNHRSLTPVVDPHYGIQNCANGYCDRIMTSDEVNEYAGNE